MKKLYFWRFDDEDNTQWKICKDIIFVGANVRRYNATYENINENLRIGKLVIPRETSEYWLHYLYFI